MKTILLILLLIAVYAYPVPAEGAPREIAPADLKARMEKESIAIVNTMSDLECMDHRIPGSVCIPCERISASVLDGLQRGSKTVVFYCDNPPCDCGPPDRPEMLVLKGGLAGWKAAGYPTESPVRIRRAPIPSISPDVLERMRREDRGVLIVDIRSTRDFGAGRMDGAIHIPIGDLAKRYQEIPLDRKIIIMDQRGGRSFLAACYLAGKGFERIAWLSGGWEGWNAHRRGDRPGGHGTAAKQDLR